MDVAVSVGINVSLGGFARLTRVKARLSAFRVVRPVRSVPDSVCARDELTRPSSGTEKLKPRRR